MCYKIHLFFTFFIWLIQIFIEVLNFFFIGRHCATPTPAPQVRTRIFIQKEKGWRRESTTLSIAEHGRRL
jgi:hypothetical protein